ncbi:periplasmic heavy metal sensor [Reyranella sp.]|uniref:Spy/CpxP family protein refolding chaperone n=1 Tax=Reyranella sp. TaxID=1929291 RepID=UPI00122BC29A|nr:periplasmic heavy metal sensor [Reyranella sp.]TAJ87414.1 MAG: periplasmic heavy metal sensor [Reyranella sp.]
MSSRLLQLLLIFSLLLNSFVIAGFVYRSWIVPPPEAMALPPPPPPPPGGTPAVAPRPGPVEVMTRELNLDEGQREALRGLIDQHAAKRRERLQEIHRDRERVAAEMRRPQPDFAKVEGLIDHVSELRSELIKENLRTLALFEPKLRPEQRERMYVIFADRFAGVPQRPREPASPRPPQ